MAGNGPARVRTTISYYGWDWLSASVITTVYNKTAWIEGGCKVSPNAHRGRSLADGSIAIFINDPSAMSRENQPPQSSASDLDEAKIEEIVREMKKVNPAEADKTRVQMLAALAKMREQSVRQNARAAELQAAHVSRCKHPPPGSAERHELTARALRPRALLGRIDH